MISNIVNNRTDKACKNHLKYAFEIFRREQDVSNKMKIKALTQNRIKQKNSS